MYSSAWRNNLLARETGEGYEVTNVYPMFYFILRIPAAKIPRHIT
jgi:hypothetical protein